MSNNKWQPSFVNGICTGIEKVIQKGDGYKYSEIIFNTILPDTDEEYERQKGEIESMCWLVCHLYNNHIKEIQDPINLNK